MLALERQKFILDYIDSNKVATTQNLSDLTHSSLATIRRDLNDMAKRGLLSKIHGGAQSLSQSMHTSENQVSALDDDPYISYKTLIAKKAVEFINSNDFIFVGAGMTCNLLCKYINESEKTNITVITTNITAVVELASNPNVTILVIGGNVHIGTNHIETLDEYTVSSLENLHFDKVFLTVDGIDLLYGYSILNRVQLPLYNHLIHNSSHIYLFANEGKFDKKAFMSLCPLDAIPNVITNASIDEKYLSYYSEHGINVFTV